eukprot:TRINITY_DN76658_c0_g1_i1.p1 TRINITY_DN76658_c0_g1~~TRINITY_DN76658_c0_g1_i1.p1  ORF type:complete len:372 (+),score=67.54 TRINITY_DN76658_c0_g1_i1:161-1276(+)
MPLAGAGAVKKKSKRKATAKGISGKPVQSVKVPCQPNVNSSAAATTMTPTPAKSPTVEGEVATVQSRVPAVQRIAIRPKRQRKPRSAPKRAAQISDVSDSSSSDEGDATTAASATASAIAAAAEKVKVASEAVEAIRAALERQGGIMTQCPDDWHFKYKIKIGSYKKFLRSKKEEFLVTDTEDSGFIVTKAGQPPPDDLVSSKRPQNWRKLLGLAWRTYLTTVAPGTAAASASVTAAPSGPDLLEAFFRPISENAAPTQQQASVGVCHGQNLGDDHVREVAGSGKASVEGAANITSSLPPSASQPSLVLKKTKLTKKKRRAGSLVEAPAKMSSTAPETEVSVVAKAKGTVKKTRKVKRLKLASSAVVLVGS